jgi:hypothetical protein
MMGLTDQARGGPERNAIAVARNERFPCVAEPVTVCGTNRPALPDGIAGRLA